jgi:hypothetical protein
VEVFDSASTRVYRVLNKRLQNLHTLRTLGIDQMIILRRNLNKSGLRVSAWLNWCRVVYWEFVKVTLNFQIP